MPDDELAGVHHTRDGGKCGGGAAAALAVSCGGWLSGLGSCDTDARLPECSCSEPVGLLVEKFDEVARNTRESGTLGSSSTATAAVSASGPARAIGV